MKLAFLTWDKKFFSLIFLFFFVVLLILSSFFLYNWQLTNNLFASVERTLGEVSEQQKSNLNTQIQAEISSIKSLAAVLSVFSHNKKAVVSAINGALKETLFENMAVVNAAGIGVDTAGNSVNLSGKSYFERARRGETVFSEPVLSENNDHNIVLAVPIQQSDQIHGVLIGTYNANRLGTLLLPSFDNNGYAFIINAQGKIIAKAQGNQGHIYQQNIHQALQEVQFNNEHTAESVISNIEKGLPGKISYRMNGIIQFAQYDRLSINDWYIFTAVPEDVIVVEFTKISAIAIIMAFSIAAGFVVLLMYISSQRKQADKTKRDYMRTLEKMAFYDELTGLPNLIKFKIDAAKIADEHKDVQFVIIKFDIVNFKMINEFFHFGVGDKIILAVAELIPRIREIQELGAGVYARIGDDEFIVFDPAGETPDEIYGRQLIFEQLFNQKVAEILGSYRIEFRYGRYFMDKNERDINACVEKANLAHRMAKNEKQITTFDYTLSFKEHAMREVALQNNMENALINNEFTVYFQPKHELKNGSVCGAEALVRWKQKGKILPPSEFIPLFEKNGFITKLDMYVFENVCAFMAILPKKKRTFPISVNFSQLHLHNTSFIDEIAHISKQYHIPPSLLEIELTETTLFENIAVTNIFFDKLHNIGFQISMDDFGTGYSSLGLLKNLKVDSIKIDRSFFVNAVDEKRSRAIIETIITMAKKLQITTIAEGIEEKKQIDLLRELACDAVQGYYFSKPMSQDDFCIFLEKELKIP